MDTQLDEFTKQYRSALERSRDADIMQINQQRLNDQATIMSQANTTGALYSNFPTRTKMQYDINTYNPNLINIQTAYQTGLDSLRNKGVELANYLRQGQESLDDYAYYTSLLQS